MRPFIGDILWTSTACAVAAKLSGMDCKYGVQYFPCPRLSHHLDVARSDGDPVCVSVHVISTFLPLRSLHCFLCSAITPLARHRIMLPALTQSSGSTRGAANLVGLGRRRVWRRSRSTKCLNLKAGSSLQLGRSWSLIFDGNGSTPTSRFQSSAFGLGGGGPARASRYF